MRKATPLLAILLLFPAAMAEDAPPQDKYTITRPKADIPWLEKTQDVPYQVVPYASIPLLREVPQSTQFYEIASDVVVSGYSYFFYVRSATDEFLVGTIPGLLKLCHELAVVDQIRQRNPAKEFASGVKQSVVGIGTGVGNLITHPGQSLAGFGHRLRITGRSLERTVGAEDRIGSAQSGVDRQDLGEGPAGGNRRRIAAELGIDVYTDNPVLRRELTQLSQVQAAGGFATWVIPYHIGTLAEFNPLSADAGVEKLLVDFNPYEVRRKVGEDLQGVFAQSREGGESDLSRFLQNPNYTPREVAYVGQTLRDMAGITGLDIVLRSLAGADTPERADFLSLEARLYNLLHRHVAPIQSFHSYLNMFAATDRNGVFNFLFAADTLRPWHVTMDAFNMMLKDAINLRSRGMTIWVLGDVDASLVEAARGKNVVVNQNIMADPRFFTRPGER